MDQDYWINLAAQWIQQRHVTNMNPALIFPTQMPQQMFFQPQHELLPPPPPKLSFHDTADDNFTATDMDLEDDQVNDVPAQQNWPQQTSTSTLPVPLFQTQNPQNVQNNKPQSQMFPSAFQSSAMPPTPMAPVISNDRPNFTQNLPDSTQSVDMILGSDPEDENNDNENDAKKAAEIEARKRKKLPLWLREALEKREREKKLEEEKLEKERKFETEEETRKKEMEEALKELEREKKRQRLQSEEYEEHRDEEDESEEELQQLQDGDDDDDEDEDSEIVYERMVAMVRNTLTEILIEVTDKMIQEISTETHSKMCKKASSVTSIRPSGLVNLGLGAYSDSSDDDSETETNKTDDGNVIEPESVIRDRIRSKSYSYHQKTKDVNKRLAQLEELENRIFNRNANASEPVSRNQSEDESSDQSKNHRNDGEEKYEKNSSIGGTFARQRDRKSRFNDLKDRTSNLLVTHVGMINPVTAEKPVQMIPNPPPITRIESHKKDDMKSSKRSQSSSSNTSSSGKSKKHKKKHKKSSKRSKKSSRKRSRSRSSSRKRSNRERSRSHDRKVDRRSMESKSSVRSSESSRKRRSRSRSRDRDRHHRSSRY